jgi:hypothetical protein
MRRREVVHSGSQPLSSQISASVDATLRAMDVPNDTGRAEQLVFSEIPLTPEKRNGHAQVIGRIVDLLASPAASARRPRTIRLSREDERLLSDADDRQLPIAQLALARDGAQAEVRAMLCTHFRRRFDLLVTFDASETSTE